MYVFYNIFLFQIYDMQNKIKIPAWRLYILQIYTNTNTNTNIPKGYPMDTRQPSRDPIKQIVFKGSVQHTCLLDSS